MEVTILCYPRHFFPLNPIHVSNILLAEMQLFLCKLHIFFHISIKIIRKLFNVLTI